MCGLCHRTGEANERRIANSEAPYPADPEDRIRGLRENLAVALAQQNHDSAARIRAAIEQLESVIETWAGTPTKYKPDPKLKGGK